MASFNDWLRENQNKRDDTNALWVAATTLGRDWPRSSLDKADYEDALAKESDPAARARLLETLNRDWRAFRSTLTADTQSAGSAGQPSKLAAIGTFFAANAGVIATSLLVLVLAFFLSAIFSKELLDHLKDVPTARGLITFLFAFTTVGIFFIVVASNFLSNLQGDEFAKRYQNGKDVLTLLIGVFGTIIGFYFGQATTTPSNPPPNVIVQPASPPTPPAQPPAPPVSPNQPAPPGPTNPGNAPTPAPG
jgi:hypothetical protein